MAKSILTMGPRRLRWTVWKLNQRWIPTRISSGVSVRKHVWWRWMGHRWFVRFVETEAEYRHRRDRYLAWKAARGPQESE